MKKSKADSKNTKVVLRRSARIQSRDTTTKPPKSKESQGDMWGQDQGQDHPAYKSNALKQSQQDHLGFLIHDQLQVQPPIKTNSIRNFDPYAIAADARATRIIVHERFPELVEAFLKHKQINGSRYEKALYHPSFTWRHEVARLLEKRAMVFMGHDDLTVLRNGLKVPGDPRKEWDRVGRHDEHLNRFLTLQEYLSYDEIMLGSLLGVSGPSYFINDGNRNNRGKPAKEGTFETRGIVLGLVGARFEREDRMDWPNVLGVASNTPYQHPDLTKLFGKTVYGHKPSSMKPGYFDTSRYQSRMYWTFEMLLKEANERGLECSADAYVYVVGLGLGVWSHHPDQETLYLRVFKACLRNLKLENKIPLVKTIEFAYIKGHPQVQEEIRREGEKVGCRIIFSTRNPAEKLDVSNVRPGWNQILCLTYAWDGNSMPGNEYWMGSLSASGDPAAACMSTIGELHNPLVNPYTNSIKVLK